MMKTPASFAIGLVAVTFFTFMAPPARAEADRLSVVATFSIIGDFARQVGGDRIDLTTLIGPQGDAHVYEPRPAAAIALARADVILVNGAMFEGFLTRLIEASGTSAPVTELTEGAHMLPEAEGGHHHDHDHGHDDEARSDRTPHDPHAWQSVANARVYVGNVARAFCAADAEGCTTYEENARAYIDELTALDEEIRQAIDAIPEDRRVAVVAHHAFRYFEDAYGVTFLAPQGVSTDSEASAADVAALTREIRDHRAVAVFAENIADARLVEQIASEAGLSLGGTLYSDALSLPDGPAPTYAALMRHNAATLAAALAAD